MSGCPCDCHKPYGRFLNGRLQPVEPISYPKLHGGMPCPCQEGER